MNRKKCHLVSALCSTQLLFFFLSLKTLGPYSFHNLKVTFKMFILVWSCALLFHIFLILFLPIIIIYLKEIQ